MKKERWKPVKGYEGSYEVSDHGRVRSLDRLVTKRTNYSGSGKTHKQFCKGRVLKPFLTGRNKYLVNLIQDGEQVQYSVGRLVAMHFKPCKSMHTWYVLHKDRDPTNNHYKNLKWARPDVVANYMSGGKFFDKRERRLAVAKVRAATKMLAAGKSHREIARDLCISTGTISLIRNGNITPQGRRAT